MMPVIGKLVKTTKQIFYGRNWPTLVCNLNHDFLPFSTKVELPSPPKKPLTAYMIFCKENRKSLLEENPSLSTPEQIKILAEKWSHLSPVLRKPYENSAREGTIVYGQIHKEFYENLTETQRLELTRLKEEKKESRRLFRLKKDLRESGIPRHPNTAYNLFLRFKAKEKNEFVHPTEFVKETAAVWRNLSDDAKQTFIEQAKVDKQRYENEMNSWRAGLIESGKRRLLLAYDGLKGKGKSLILDDTTSKPKRKSSKKEISPEGIDSKN